MVGIYSDLWTLAQAACVMGAALLVLNVPALAFPAGYRNALAAFPRHAPSAWLLTALALGWSALVLNHIPLGRLEFIKPSLILVGPLSFVLIVMFLDELLAPRALGGLLLLAGCPYLDVARWHESPLRHLVTVLVYLGVCLGMVLVLSPYRFRYLVERLGGTPSRIRVTGTVGLALGLLLLFLGLKVY